MRSNVPTLRAISADLPENALRFLCQQTSFRAKGAVEMIATEIVTAAEQGYLLPMDPFDCPLIPTGGRVSKP
jgi:hypothetical protein